MTRLWFGVLVTLAACSGYDNSAQLTSTQPVGTTELATSTSTPPTSNSVDRAIAACQARELAGQFFGVGFGTGNDFGIIVVRDTSSNPCRLTGAIEVHALDAAGREITTPSLVVFQLTSDIVLGANRPGAQHGSGAPSATAELRLGGGERDDPTSPNGLCSAADEVTPATWALRFGSGQLTVPNRDARTSPMPGQLFACHAGFFAFGVNPGTT